MSPMERALADLRKRGYRATRTEHWNHWARIRQDLFGFIDILALAPGIILGVQVTSGAHHADRRSKAGSLPILREWLEAGGRFSIWSYALRGETGKRKVWTLREEPITLKNLEAECQQRPTTDSPNASSHSDEMQG